MFTTALRGFLIACFVLVFGGGLSWSQNLYEVQTRPVRGFMPNMDQLSSPVDHIDPVSRKVHIEIPLASLPSGRAGSGFDLNLVYDTRFWNLKPELIMPPVSYETYAAVPGYELEHNSWDRSGWSLNVDNVGLDYEERIPESDYWPQCSDGPQRQYRLRIRLLDGSSHLLHLKGHEDYTDLSREGFYPMNPGGDLQCFQFQTLVHWQQQTGWLTYYTVDGSYLKLEIYADGTGNWGLQPWYLYFPDGRKIVGYGLGGALSFYDANNNRVQVSNVCGGGCLYGWSKVISDDSGREIVVSETGDYWNSFTTTVTTAGPNGPRTSTLNWELYQLGADGRRYTKAASSQWWPNPPDVTLPLSRYMTRLKYIQLPLEPPVPTNQTPSTWNSYAFGYSDDTDAGFGEVDMVRTPTGAIFQYQYSNEGMQDHLSAAIAHENRVYERRVSQPGQPDLVWTYTGYWGSTTGTIVTNPDSSQTTYWFGPGLNSPSSEYVDTSIPGFGGPGQQMVYRIDEPNGTVRKRLWSANAAPPWMGNAWVKRETVTRGNASGAPTLTAVTDKVIDKNGNTLQTVEYDWVSFNPSGPEVGTSPLRTVQFQYYAEVPSYTSLTFSDPQTYANVHFSPLGPTQARRLDAVRRKEVRDASNAIVSVSEFTYDDEYRRGNVTVTKHWDSVKSPSPPGLGGLDGSNSQVLSRSYDAYGNVEDIYVPEVRTHITYDATGSFPELVHYAYATPEQRTWRYQWHTPSGTLTWKKDEDNDITTAYQYDIVGRPTSVIEGAQPGLSTGVRKTKTIYGDPNRTVTVKKDLRTFDYGELEVVTEYDYLGRVSLVKTTEPGNPGGINVKTSYYPTLNRTVQSSAYRTTTDVTLEWTCTQKDASQRVIAVAVFKGATEPTDCETVANRTSITRTVHDANWTWITDPALKARGEASDSLGRLVQVKEDPGQLDYDTVYAYDGLGNLTQVTQGDQQRLFTYSSLSRLLSTNNPESGLASYTYNDGGSLLTRTDARGVVATFGYDDMHRIRTKTYSNDPQSTPAVTYNYYTSGAPKVGQLQSVVSSAASQQEVARTEYTNYDELGRVRGSTHAVDGFPTPQSFVYNYWLNDGVKSVQYPSGRVVNYDVDDAGRINKVRDAQSIFADLTNIASPFSPYTADGRISAMRLGNELWETRDYQTPGTATKYKVGTALGNNQLLELEYNFSGDSNNGNLVSHTIRNYRFNPVRTWSQSYSYDALNRLRCAAEAANPPVDPCTQGDYWRQEFGYDRYGNRWVSSVTGLTGTDVHEPTVQTNFNSNTNRLFLQGSNYDAAGNQTIYTPYTLGYDAENRNVSVSSASNGSGTFTYDGDGKRVKKTWTNSIGTTTTYYFRNALGQLAVEYSSESSPNPERVYVHTDMLGSTRLVTSDKPANWPSSTASIVECYDYVPFGRMLNSGDALRNTGCYPPNPDYELSSQLPQKFTGKERDAETRLDYFGARYYSAAQGRFISADWSSTPTAVPYADFRNPQTLNLYSYLQNNPLSSVDTDGHCGNNDWCDYLKGLGIGTWNFAKNTVVGTAQFGWAAATNPLKAQAMLTSPFKIAYEDYTTMGFAGVGNALLDQGVEGATAIVTEAVLTGGLAGSARVNSISPRTTLYRAVDAVEAADIHATGRFTPSPNGTEFKGFFNTAADAREFGARMEKLTGDAYTVYSGDISNKVLRKSPDHIAATEGKGKLIPNEQLQNVTKVKELKQ